MVQIHLGPFDPTYIVIHWDFQRLIIVHHSYHSSSNPEEWLDQSASSGQLQVAGIYWGSIDGDCSGLSNRKLMV